MKAWLYKIARQRPWSTIAETHWTGIALDQKWQSRNRGCFTFNIANGLPPADARDPALGGQPQPDQHVAAKCLGDRNTLTRTAIRIARRAN
jgi:hypothetical protein